ncbi:MAG: TRAP transporter small permease subunit [Cyclobacteriaceae bacterium]
MKRLIETILKLGTIISTAGFVGSTLIQIFARFALASAPSWTEEASRFFFVYAMSFAAGLAMKDNYYVHLDVFYEKLSKSVQAKVDIAIPILIMLLFFIMGIFGVQYVILGIPESSPSLGLSMSLAFVSIVFMSISIIIYAFFELKSKLGNKS